jgi:uncharacterized protein
MAPDVNVLVAAFRSDHPLHRPARGWLTQAVDACASGGTLEILPMVAAGFLRVVTNPRAFTQPDTMPDAVAFLAALLEVPGVSTPELGREWSALATLCLERNLRGNQVPDAWIAAVVATTGLHLVTFDRDFARLLRGSEYTLLDEKPQVQDVRGSYAVRGRFYRPRRVQA